ncbi:MAG: hypothetical protein HC841_01485 [Verrucomicrobiae bacterium]|nr:hypothetical protein [Verrucomicrobiae bacterium]
MQPDPVLAEVWRAKDNLASEANYDVATLFKQLRETEHTSGRKYVSLESRKPSAKRKKQAR